MSKASYLVLLGCTAAIFTGCTGAKATTTVTTKVTATPSKGAKQARAKTRTARSNAMAAKAMKKPAQSAKKTG